MAGKLEIVEEEGNQIFPNRKGIVPVASKPTLAASVKSLFCFSCRRKRCALIPPTSPSVNSSTRIERMIQPSPSVNSSTRIERMIQRRSQYATEAEFEIDASKDHWSELQLDASSSQEDEAAQTNLEIVESLRRQWPDTGNFFHHYGDDLKVGVKIAEGGQAEIFEVENLGKNTPLKYVLKVFKEGVSVRDLQRQWPPGMLQQITGRCWPAGTYWPEGTSPILCGTVVMNGRFAFQMIRCWGDLRKLIDFRMQLHRYPLFSDKQLWENMFSIAKGMRNLHNDNIVHRDLKASNVLITRLRGPDADPPLSDFYWCVIADFECSVGVVGTGFWRAPEILEALKNRNVTPNLFTEKSDVYSFAMTCYEMITGKLPFEDVRLNDYDVVLRGDRPMLPKGTKPWLRDLLNRCWHADPLERPDFREIVQLMEEQKRRDSRSLGAHDLVSRLV